MTLAFGPTVADARTWLLFAHAAATLYMTGLIWFVQVVDDPKRDRTRAGRRVRLNRRQYLQRPT